MGVEGLEPSRSLGSTDFKSVASTDSATPPIMYILCNIIIRLYSNTENYNQTLINKA